MEVIEDLHARFIKGKPYPLPLPEMAPASPEDAEPYVGNPRLPAAVLVDIDGTVAQMHDRSPYDMTRVSEDAPKDDVVMVVRALRNSGLRIVFVSARNEVARRDTERWLKRHVTSGPFELHMRADGDGRSDRVVKREIFDEKIRPHFNVRAVLDDRDQVVSMWRSLGITCLQVAPGAF